MAARKSTDRRFYVYVIEDGANAHYVGKGSGNRLRAQQRKFRLSGRVLEWFSLEVEAFAAERKWIALLKPCENRCAGGNGNTVRRKGASARKPKWLAEIEEMGARKYAARILLAIYKAAPHLVDSSKVDAFRQVAYGCRV